MNKVVIIITRFTKNTVLAGVLFGFAMGVLFGLRYGVDTGVRAGIQAGLLFGIILALFIEWMHSQRSKMQRKVLGNQEVIYSGNANHVVGKTSDGGWLFLTKDQLLFVPHAFNGPQAPHLSIALPLIKNVYISRTFGIVPNGLSVQTPQGIYTFVVHSRKQWVAHIAKLRQG